MSRILGGFETILLFSLLELDQDAHSVAIRRLIEERTGRITSPGAVHTALVRLERRGLIASRADAEPPKRGGRPRRYYTLTEAGVEQLHESHEALRHMAAGLEGKLARAASGSSAGS